MKYDIKMNVLGPEEGQEKEVKLLNRVLRWTPQGLEYEADQRHAGLVVKELGLHNAKTVTTPYPPEGYPLEPSAVEPAGTCIDGSKYRAISARINFLALDRSDLQYASKCASQGMSSPTKRSWETVKRIGRYLKGVPRIVQEFPWESHVLELTGFADSDWAGDRQTLKSTSGGAIMWGKHCLKTWSSSQSTTALSSGEAELYAVTKAAVQTSGLISLASDFGIVLKGVVRTDSNAAIGIVHRRGLGGRCKHIKIQYLWIQERVKSGELVISKVWGKLNPADLMTKGLPAREHWNHLQRLGFGVRDGRATKSSSLNVLIDNDSDRWLIRGSANREWMRVHLKPRCTRFAPLKTAKGPKCSNEVGDYRHSFAWGCNGGYSHCVEKWKELKEPQERFLGNFTGVTIFTDDAPCEGNLASSCLRHFTRGGVSECTHHAL